MASDYIYHVPMTKWLLDNYASQHNHSFPGASQTHYDTVLLSTHQYLNEFVHLTVQNRAALIDEGMYLTDHGPKHIEVVMKRASKLIQTVESLRHPSGKSAFYEPSLNPYEVFLLALSIHFHDVGNMYGREAHEENIGRAMAPIGALSISWHEKNLIQKIAACHGGTFNGSKDTIQRLPAETQENGTATYRPQLLAAILRLADELADEYSRADNFGLQNPSELPATCLLYHKYASALTVSIKPLAGQISLKFMLHSEDLIKPFQKREKDGGLSNVFLLDEIYMRTLKTYHEMVYCQRYMRELDTHLHEVRVEIQIFEHRQHSAPIQQFHYTIGDFEYPQHTGTGTEALKVLSHDFEKLPAGEKLAAILSGHKTQNAL